MNVKTKQEASKSTKRALIWYIELKFWWKIEENPSLGVNGGRRVFGEEEENEEERM